MSLRIHTVFVALLMVIVGLADSPQADATSRMPHICLGARSPYSLGNNVYTEGADAGVCDADFCYRGRYKSVSGASIWVRYTLVSSTGTYTTPSTTPSTWIYTARFFDSNANAPVSLCQDIGGFPACQSPYSNYGF